MDWPRQIRGFYAIIDRRDDTLADALLPHACALQIRNKRASPAELEALARWAAARCRDAGVLLIVNDSVDVAMRVGADAVHLGQTDTPIGEARARLPRHIRIGISTHDQTQVGEAVRAGADYLGYGPVFATSTKDNPDPVQGLVALARAVELAGATPVVAIGGIHPEHGEALRATGVAAAAAIASIIGATEPARAAQRLTDAWRRTEP